jgi:hypothetical protein
MARTYRVTSSVLAGQPIDLATGQAGASGQVLTPEHVIGGLYGAMGLAIPDDVDPFTAVFDPP